LEANRNNQMARLKVLGSGSSGNCYLLECKDESLILEAGFNYKDILTFIGFDLGRIAGVLVSHEHNDHAKGLVGCLNARLNVYASSGTFSRFGILTIQREHLRDSEVKNIGGFKVFPFAVHHDANEPLNFLIYHQEFGTLLFITDTYYVDQTFSGLNHIIIETNYSKEFMDCNYQDRVIRSHMSLETAIETLKANDLSKVKTITLCHLSDKNSNEKVFVENVERATGKAVYVANKGLNLEL
jgi:phosphoribosyl 1,2-cyclic phosphodiesterase